MKLANIPTNIITGFLGVGKTTAITSLLKSKPPGERWAVLVNEFGEVGIDGSLFAGESTQEQGIFIKEVPGGCMCCTAGLSMQMALGMLLAKAKPQRLLIEPTGLGHPQEVIDTLSSEYYREVLALNNSVTLVDARKIADKRYTDNHTFNEQLDVADVIIANKVDQYDDKDFLQLLNYLNARYGENLKPLYPVSYGELKLNWLEGKASAIKAPAISDAHHSPPESPLNLAKDPSFPDSGYISISNSGEGFTTHGWIFKPDFVFDRQKVISLLHGVEVERAKGVFITHQGIVGLNKVDDVLTEIALEDSLDSRVELIFDNAEMNMEGFEDALLACT